MFDGHKLFWWEVIFEAEKNQNCASFNNVTRTAVGRAATWGSASQGESKIAAPK